MTVYSETSQIAFMEFCRVNFPEWRQVWTMDIYYLEQERSAEK